MKRILIILLVLLSCNAAVSQWTRVNGPVSGEIKSVLYKDNMLFAGGNNGVFRSSDGGNSWIPAMNGLSSKPVKYLAAKNANIIAGLTDGYFSDIFISADYGISWTNITGGLYDKILTGLAAGSNYLVASTTSGIYRYSGSGSSWTMSNTGLTSIVINVIYDAGTSLCAGTESGVSISTDYGVTWASYNNEISNLSITALARKDNFLFANRYYNTPYISSNGGVNWTQMQAGFVGTTSLFFVAGQNIYAGVSSNGAIVYKSTNNGTNWVNGGTLVTNANINSMCSDGNNIFAGTSYGFFKSQDGLNWTAKNTGLLVNNVGSLLFNGGALYAGGDKGSLNISTDAGQTWTSRYVTSGTGVTVKLQKVDIYLILQVNYSQYLESSTIYKTSNEGQNWSVINQYYYNKLVGVNNNVIYVNDWGGGIKCSYDYGASWFTYSTLPVYTQAKTLLFIDSMKVLAGTRNGIYYTTNNGQSWTPTGISNIEINKFIYSGNYYFAATVGGVYRSGDITPGWNLCGLNDRIINDIISVNGKIIAATDNGIYVSSDNGQNWAAKNQGFEVIPTVNSLSVNDNYIYAGTAYQSTWKRPVIEVIGVENISTEVPSAFSLYQNYPNPFNPITKIRFDIPADSRFRWNDNVVLKVYDILGKEAATLVNEKLQPGTYEATWDATGFGSGVYFYRLATNDGIKGIKKMVLIK